MRQFKLIKEYPASPKLGFIVLERHCGMYHNIETGNMYGSQMIESHPEYWEEVVEKDYEILISRVVPQEILSVKRLSDGEVFTVGDEFKATIGSRDVIRTIQRIKVEGDIITIHHENGDLSNQKHFGIFHTIKKVKQPIFLTHDGKNIYEGDKVWYVNKENFYYDYILPSYDYILPSPGIKFCSDINAYFLTREDAEDYIKRNRPRLSIEDCFKILQNQFLYSVGFEESIEEYIRKNNK